MTNKTKISSIIIAKNEEANIQRCIESQLGCIDEIILLIDNKTTDRTKEVAAQFKKVVCKEVQWQGFSKTKQMATQLACNDWIFWIDADEEITTELAEELKQFKNGHKKYRVYSVARRAFFLGKWIKHSGWYPGRVNRLFNKNFAKFSDSNVHEHLVFEGEVGKLANDLNHYTDPNLTHYFEKLNNYTSLAANDLLKKNRKVFLKDILLRPIFIFVKMFFLRLGFLDGYHGLVLAMLSSAYVFVKYVKLWEIKGATK